jgi:hypothetical protein
MWLKQLWCLAAARSLTTEKLVRTTPSLILVPKSQMSGPARFDQVRQITSQAVQSGFQQLEKSAGPCHPLRQNALLIT